MKQIVKNFLKGFKQIGEETGKELLNETGKIVTETINPAEWLGDIKPMDSQQYDQTASQEERKKQEEMADVRSQISGMGRPVEKEMEAIRKEKEETEEEKERKFLEELRIKRERERQEEAAAAEAMESGNPHKKKKKKGSAFAKGKGKASTSDMSATGEFKGKID